MSRTNDTASDAISIHELFLNNQKYQMPLFQRTFEWQADPQLNRFWVDIGLLIDGATENIFMGAIVLQQEERGTSSRSTKYTVIDTVPFLTYKVVINNHVYRPGTKGAVVNNE